MKNQKQKHDTSFIKNAMSKKMTTCMIISHNLIQLEGILTLLLTRYLLSNRVKSSLVPKYKNIVVARIITSGIYRRRNLKCLIFYKGTNRLGINVPAIDYQTIVYWNVLRTTKEIIILLNFFEHRFLHLICKCIFTGHPFLVSLNTDHLK